MSNVSKNLTKTLGGAAAAVLSVAGLARAQQAGAVVPATRRDSTVTQRVIILPGRMDSIAFIAAKIVQERPGNTAWIMLTSQLDTLIASSVNKRFGVMRGGIVGPPAMMLRADSSLQGLDRFYQHAGAVAAHQ